MCRTVTEARLEAVSTGWARSGGDSAQTPLSGAGGGALRCLPFASESHLGPFLSELMTMSSRMPSQSRARPWRWCPAHPHPPHKCCSSHLLTPPSASRRQWPWGSSRPLCRTCVWPIGTHCRPTVQEACSQEAQAHPSTPRTPLSSPWTCALCPSLHPSACRWPLQPSPGTASPPPTEAATSVGVTRSLRAVLTDRALLGHPGRTWGPGQRKRMLTRGAQWNKATRRLSLQSLVALDWRGSVLFSNQRDPEQNSQ